MKVCQIRGNMSAERTSEAYPTDVFCDECYDEMNVEGEDNPIMSVEAHDSTWDDSCSKCGKSLEDEEAENETL